MDFTVSFQLKLLALFYTEKGYYSFAKEYVKVEFFNSMVLQWLYQLLERYESVYRGLPTRLVVEEELAGDTNFVILPEEAPLLAEFLALLTSGNIVEKSYIKDSFNKFARSKSIKSILSEHSEAIEEGDIDTILGSLRTESVKFDHTGTKLLSKYLFSLDNLNEIYSNTGGIKTGIGLIDNVVGGLMPKEMSLVLADTNVGKSLFLTHVGGKAIRQMRKVLHVTLEMSLARTLIRYLANLAEPEDGISYSNIYNADPLEKVYDYVERLREKYEDWLYIEEFPTGKCSINDLYRLLDKYPGVELLIVDYLELLKPDKRRAEVRFEQSDLTIGLRGIASERGIHVMTATQASRQASNRRIIGKEVTSEDYGKMRIADIGIGMGQNKNDVAKHEVVLYLTRSRNSAKHMAERYFVDFEGMKLKMMGQELLNVSQD